jgi:fimbrial chaperone protein
MNALARVSRAMALALMAAPLVLASGAVPAEAQALTVLPVTIEMAPGQKAAVLTVTSAGQTSFQVRAYEWRQNENGDVQLADTDALLASPPLGTIAAGASQVIRLVLRRLPAEREATYRILVDQIPPPAAPGIVQVALRLSIPIFVLPQARVAPHVTWRVESAGGQSFLVGVNDGTRHLKVHDLALRAAGGATVAVETKNVSPYLLAGTTRRWRLAGRPPGGALRLTGSGDDGAIDQQVSVNGR